MNPAMVGVPSLALWRELKMGAPSCRSCLPILFLTKTLFHKGVTASDTKKAKVATTKILTTLKTVNDCGNGLIIDFYCQE
jgi:hypothetical protein